MMVDPESAELRRRADGLRALAARVETVRLDEVLAWCGPDTWRSPGAEACRAMLEVDRQRLAHAADDLRRSAWRLDRQADALDAAAALTLPIR